MSVEDAEDAVHEAMLRAGENPNIDDERLAAWLTTVTMRLCVDRYRQLNREAEVSSRSALVAPAPVPVEEVVCDRAEAKWLARRSRSLPARQAEALRLKSEDLDVDQVATQMGLSYEATESLLARARRAMRGLLAGTLALVVCFGRGRPETAGAQVAGAASTAATLAVLGIALPYSYDADRSPAPQVSRTEVVDEPTRERDQEESAPTPRSTAGPDSGPTRTPGFRKPLAIATSLVPPLSAPTAPKVPDVRTVPSELPDGPAVPTVPSEGPAVPTVPSKGPAAPTVSSDERPSTVAPKNTGTAVPKDAGVPPVERPDSGALPTEVGQLGD